jgi:hypothetical protein
MKRKILLGAVLALLVGAALVFNSCSCSGDDLGGVTYPNDQWLRLEPVGSESEITIDTNYIEINVYAFNDSDIYALTDYEITFQVTDKSWYQRPLSNATALAPSEYSRVILIKIDSTNDSDLYNKLKTMKMNDERLAFKVVLGSVQVEVFIAP